MTTEVTIRFTAKNPDLYTFMADVQRFDEDAVCRGWLIHGLYFHMEECPGQFMLWLFDEGFEMEDFTSIKFKPVTK